MSNIIKFPSQSEQDEKEFESIKELEYTSYDMRNIYLHWGKNRGLRAEAEPAGGKLILKINENDNRAWIYTKEWNGIEHKYILEPKLFPALGLIVSDDVNQLVGGLNNIYDLYYIYLHYIIGFHTEKTIEHNQKYIQNIKDIYKAMSSKEKNINDKDFFLSIIDFPIIEKFD